MQEISRESIIIFRVQVLIYLSLLIIDLKQPKYSFFNYMKNFQLHCYGSNGIIATKLGC